MQYFLSISPSSLLVKGNAVVCALTGLKKGTQTQLTWFAEIKWDACTSFTLCQHANPHLKA